MFSRPQSRNTGFSENLFSHNPRVDNNTLSSIDGANALKLDESFEIKEEEQKSTLSNFEENIENENFIYNENQKDQSSSNIPSGVSIESASYIENNNIDENQINLSEVEENNESYNPKLFSDEQNYQTEDTNSDINHEENIVKEELFDQDINEEEDFEIPAFLRKQKF